MLSALFREILTDDQTHLHVRDYAYYLYRALSSGVDEFKTVFLTSRKQTPMERAAQQSL